MSAPARISHSALGLAAELDDPEFRGSSRRWIAILAFLVLAALLHLGLFESPWVKNLTWLSGAPPQPMEVNQVDSKKLDAIRRQWAREKEKSLLLNKNQPRSETAPENSRYMSDRNLRVEKEQRAREQQVIPKPGAAGEPQKKREARPKAKPRTDLPSLQSLGVPIPLTQKAKADTDEPRENSAARSGNLGGDQAVLDKNLPEGSENLLNAQESVYYSFYARLYEAIGPLWQSQVSSLARGGFQVPPGDYSTLVDVVLDAEGNLVAVRLMQASGVSVFDRIVDDSWHKVSRFPNPPKGLLKGGQVHTGWTFTVSVNQGLGFQNLPPERNY